MESIMFDLDYDNCQVVPGAYENFDTSFSWCSNTGISTFDSDFHLEQSTFALPTTTEYGASDQALIMESFSTSQEVQGDVAPPTPPSAEVVPQPPFLNGLDSELSVGSRNMDLDIYSAISVDYQIPSVSSSTQEYSLSWSPPSVPLQSQGSPGYHSDDNVSTPEFEENIEVYHDLIMPWVTYEINTQAAFWEIPQEPQLWTNKDAKTWWVETAGQNEFSVDRIKEVEWSWTGKELSNLPMEDFCNIDSVCGEQMHGRLQIWNAAAEFRRKQEETVMAFHTNPQFSPGAQVVAASVPNGTSLSPGCVDAEHSLITESVDDALQTKSNIQLWKFIRQLLDEPERFGAVVRYLNREQGIFKIEDSHALAKLWGQRKNRPQMNYDKLSRSLRQYYRKGILRKTPKAQRLVYQFCLGYVHAATVPMSSKQGFAVSKWNFSV